MGAQVQASGRARHVQLRLHHAVWLPPQSRAVSLYALHDMLGASERGSQPTQSRTRAANKSTQRSRSSGSSTSRCSQWVSAGELPQSSSTSPEVHSVSCPSAFPLRRINHAAGLFVSGPSCSSHETPSARHSSARLPVALARRVEIEVLQHVHVRQRSGECARTSRRMRSTTAPRRTASVSWSSSWNSRRSSRSRSDRASTPGTRCRNGPRK